MILDLPASILETGEYELVLQGVIDKKNVEDVGYYYFDVVRK